MTYETESDRQKQQRNAVAFARHFGCEIVTEAPLYVDEFAWRLNEGDVKRHTLLRLDSFIDAIVGKRLTYARLIAKVSA